MKILKWILLVALLGLACSTDALAHDSNSRRTPQRAREEARKRESAERDSRKSRERAEERSRRTEAEPSQRQTLRNEGVRTLLEAVQHVPEHTSVKRWGREIERYANEVLREGNSSSLEKIESWTRDRLKNGHSTEFERSQFRGALREINDVITLARDGYKNIRWQVASREIEARTPTGETVPLGTRRFDLAGTSPHGERVYFETKASKLSTLTEAHMDMLRKAKTPSELVGAYRESSRDWKRENTVFKELVKDIWLAGHQGVKIEWKVEAGPGGLIQELARFGILGHRYH